MAPSSINTLPPDQATRLTELYDRYAPLVRSLAYDKLRDWHGAWDVVHDVFVALLNDMERGREAEPSQARILAIARNKVVDRVRLAQRRRERDPIDDTTAALSPGDDERHQLEQLNAAVSNLPEQVRLMVWLFYLESVPAARISEMTGVPLRTVYARLAQARRSLRSELSAAGKEVSS